MYLRMVLRSRPVRRAIADTLKPWRARSRIMTSFPSVTTHALPQSTEGIMSYGRLHGSRASAPEPCRCVSLGNLHPPDLRSIHPALTDAAVTAAQCPVGAAVGVHAKDMKEPWCLGTSHRDATAPQIIKLYSKRWTVEPSFRDTKDLRFGLGLSAVRIAD